MAKKPNQIFVTLSEICTTYYMEDIECKLMTIGATGVGKTSVVKRFVYDNFSEDYEPVNEDRFRKQILVEDNKCVINIIDICGDEGTRTTTFHNYISYSQGFFLIYSVTSLASFDDIKEQYDYIIRTKEYEDDYKPIVLIGNKADLTTQHVVSEEMGKQFAEQCGIQFFETSAKTGDNIFECVTAMVKLAMIPELKRREGTSKSNKKKIACKLL
jgi:small GTP-binding protein